MQAATHITDADGNTPLHIAVAGRNAEAVKKLLSRDDVVDVINRQNLKGATALFFAAGKGYDDMVILLLAAGADVNIANQNDATPLYFAAQEGHYEVVRLLLEADADPSISNKNAVTPQDIASRKNHRETALLIGEYARKKVYKRSDDVLSKILKKGPKNG